MRWPLGGKFELPTWFITVLYSYCHHDYRLDYECYFLGGKFQNSKLFCHFYYYGERLPQVIYLCTIALILFIHDGFLEYQLQSIVKMTRIESGVTIL
jgi:hypothetical protein